MDETCIDEHWRKVVGWPDYEVSDQGDVYSTKRLQMLSPQPTHHGKLRVTLHSPHLGEQGKLVDHLVAEAFLPTPEGDPHQRKLRHKDGDLLNNMPDNLEWE